jgi:PAS domain S-box-containing protein
LLATNLGVTAAFQMFHAPLGSLARIQMMMLAVSATCLFLGALAEGQAAMEGILLEKAAFLDALLHNTPAAIVLRDPDFRILRCNRAFERMFQYREAEIAGTTLEEIFLPDGGNGEGGNTARRSTKHETFHVTTRRRRKDGTILYLELFSTPILVRGVCVGRIGVYQDISMLVKHSRELKRSNAELEQFAYVASHDLQEPLRMITSFTRLLAEECEGKLGTEAKQYIEIVTDSARRMRALISDLLALARTGTRGKEFAEADCGRAFDAAVGILREAAQESGAEITREKLPEVEGDESQLAQVFQNLVGNALKFRGNGKPRIHASAAEIDGEWTIAVQDNGIGIDPQYAERIFGVFQRLHSRSEYAGSGIGLAICKKIVERHGGRIWVEAAPGGGSVFRFTLPVRGGHETEEESMEPEEVNAIP